MNFKFDSSALMKGLESLEDKAGEAIQMYSETGAKKLEGFMKDEALWVDRTGAARQRLTGTVSKLAKGYRITLAHGVEYGLWLELAMEKKYAIIEPTIRLHGDEVMKGFENLLNRLVGV